jgi:nucleotide-binding universal stress UspA family protein
LQISGKFLARGGGKVGEVVLTQADEDDVDMIVMGTRGHGKMMRALMGSVSHYVMSHARCPVMVFRDKVKAKQEKKEKDNGDESQEIAKKED